MSGPYSPKATPKRKRDDIISETPASKLFTASIFTFEPPSSQDSIEDGSSSPRTKVANKFRDLSLERGGGGVQVTSTPDGINGQRPVAQERPTRLPDPVIFGFGGGTHEVGGKNNMQLDGDDNVARKRHKYIQFEGDISPGAKGESSAQAAEPVEIDEKRTLTLESAVDPSLVRVVRNGSLGGLKKSYPSINRLSDSRSRGRRRSGTPPLHASRRKSTGSMEEAPPAIVDPVRAALTWHEDEITVYDSEDKDDDGTGLNGIGFRPTPAIAYQRAQKRKKQLAEYKKREETEARAQRNQRRRDALGGGTELQRQHSASRVHFSEAEPETLVMT
ncbi:hypothetical protein TruAng_006126 [Truncatella angustata]|nr:hypothetical protein TruAng_006126 [Truncatella angustata]